MKMIDHQYGENITSNIYAQTMIRRELIVNATQINHKLKLYLIDNFIEQWAKL